MKFVHCDSIFLASVWQPTAITTSHLIITTTALLYPRIIIITNLIMVATVHII